jgi:peptidoglycan/LPS O-acetylase OafA/YrhL
MTEGPSIDGARATKRHNAEPRRLHFLDGLRGVAALAVVVSHGGERVSQTVDGFLSQQLQLGQMAVALFFMISGFVIPITLERRGAASFWVSRIFRLYPLFLLVLVIAYGLHKAGLWDVGPGFGREAWILNATMLQPVFNVGYAVTTFWTLYFEIVFYLLMSLLFLVRLNRFSVTLALFFLAIANINAEWPIPVPLGLGGNGLMVFSFMFVGTVFYRLYEGRVRPWMAGAIWVLFLGTIIHVAYRSYWNANWGTFHGTAVFLPMISAWTAALVVFSIGYLLRHRRWPRVLIWLGAISYSMYLWHLLVMDVGRNGGQPAVIYGNAKITYLGYFAVTIAISWVSYRYLERPAINLGHRLASHVSRGRAIIAPRQPPTPPLAPEGATTPLAQPEPDVSLSRAPSA